MLRSKGFFWLATRMDRCGIWSQAGGACRVEPGGPWWATLPEDEIPDDPEEEALLARVWHTVWGDRRQEIVLIGQEMDEPALRAGLRACLLTNAEMELGPEGWAAFADPFSDWMLPLADSTNVA